MIFDFQNLILRKVVKKYMLCQNCHQNPATIHLTTSINGRQTSIDLCQNCYQKLKDQAGNNGRSSSMMQDPFGFGNLDDLFRAMSSDQQGAQRPPPIIARKPVAKPIPSTQQPPIEPSYAKPRQAPTYHVPTSTSAPPPAQRTTTGPRPSAPPKPIALRTGGTGTQRCVICSRKRVETKKLREAGEHIPKTTTP